MQDCGADDQARMLATLSGMGDKSILSLKYLYALFKSKNYLKVASIKAIMYHTMQSQIKNIHKPAIIKQTTSSPELKHKYNQNKQPEESIANKMCTSRKSQ